MQEVARRRNRVTPVFILLFFATKRRHACFWRGHPPSCPSVPMDDGGDLDHALILDGFASSHFLLHLLDHGRLWLGVLVLASQNIKTKTFHIITLLEWYF